jgi:hypothetical protein
MPLLPQSRGAFRPVLLIVSVLVAAGLISGCGGATPGGAFSSTGGGGSGAPAIAPPATSPTAAPTVS